MREKSKHIVRVFDPDKAFSQEMLAKEQASDPKLKSVSARWKYGLVTTPKGVFCVTEDGYGPNWVITTLGGAPIHFFKDYESRSFMTAVFNQAECESLLTGQEMSLDEFIISDKDSSFENWERRLSR